MTYISPRNKGSGGFWSYARERLIEYHGLSKEKFPLYLKEMEFRYNNRNKPNFYSVGKIFDKFGAGSLTITKNKFEIRSGTGISAD